MNDLLGAFGPIVVIWLLPLAPLMYAALADLVEGLVRLFAGRTYRAPVLDAGARRAQGETSL